MKILALLIVLLATALPAFAHPGHLAEVAGHGHWLGAAAIGAAIALGACAALKGKKSPQAQDDAAEADDETEAEEAAA